MLAGDVDKTILYLAILIPFHQNGLERVEINHIGEVQVQEERLPQVVHVLPLQGIDRQVACATLGIVQHLATERLDDYVSAVVL